MYYQVLRDVLSEDSLTFLQASDFLTRSGTRSRSCSWQWRHRGCRRAEEFRRNSFAHVLVRAARLGWGGDWCWRSRSCCFLDDWTIFALEIDYDGLTHYEVTIQLVWPTCKTSQLFGSTGIYQCNTLFAVAQFSLSRLNRIQKKSLYPICFTYSFYVERF